MIDDFNIIKAFSRRSLSHSSLMIFVFHSNNFLTYALLLINGLRKYFQKIKRQKDCIFTSFDVGNCWIEFMQLKSATQRKPNTCI